MSHYLRDQYIKNITLTEQGLREIEAELNAIWKNENEKIKRNESDPKFLFLTYAIRFDNKGFRLFSIDEVINYIQSAKEVEIISFKLFSLNYLNTNGNLGKCISITFDSKIFENSKLVVEDDDKEWVDSQFLRFREIVNRYANRNYLIRNAWTTLTVQLIGVVVGFLFSILAAIKLSPYLTLKYADGFAFVIAFLLFSNIWTYLYHIIIRLLDFLWPNITFKKRLGLFTALRGIFLAGFSTVLLILFFWLGKQTYQFIVSLLNIDK